MEGVQVCSSVGGHGWGELIGPCVGGVDGGRKGVFCPNLYLPHNTSSSMNSNIWTDILKMTTDILKMTYHYNILKMTRVDKCTSSYSNDFILYQEYARYDHKYQVYVGKSQTNETLVYAWYMQRPFQFNLAISTAKNLACVWHTYWYKNSQIPVYLPIPDVYLAYITINGPL